MLCKHSRCRCSIQSLAITETTGRRRAAAYNETTYPLLGNILDIILGRIYILLPLLLELGAGKLVAAALCPLLLAPFEFLLSSLVLVALVEDESPVD